MKFKCKANSFKVEHGFFNPKLTDKLLPLTLGKEYFVQILKPCPNWKDSFIKTYPELLIYTDNSKWEHISFKDLGLSSVTEEDIIPVMFSLLFEEKTQGNIIQVNFNERKVA